MPPTIPPKKVANADPGDADTVGGDDWDYVSDFMNDVDTTGPVKINTSTRFRDQKLQLRNPANTFTGTLIHPDLTADADLDFCFNSEGEYIAYRVGSVYKAKGLRQNNIIYSGAVAETAIQTAITAAGTYGTTIIPDRNYVLSGAFAGFDMFYNSKLIMSPGAIIDIPTGYTGSCFKIYESGGAGNVIIRGGLIEELTTPSRLWTCFDINSTSAGVVRVHIKDSRIYAAKNAVAIRTDGIGWSNGNVFDGLYISSSKVGFLFEHTGSFTAFQSGSNNNTFSNNIMQADANATHGFKDVNGRRNFMLHDYMADFTGAQITCNITANAANTEIMGGTVTALNFADLSPAGSESIINDAYQGGVATTRKLWSYDDQVATSAPASPATGTTRAYTKTLDANNDGRFYKARVNGAVVEVAF